MQFPEIGGKIIIIERCDSTNSELIRICTEDKAFSGTVVLAYEQTEGRGQRGNSWQSEPGKDLTFSFVLAPAGIKADQAFLPVAAAALAVKTWAENRMPGKKVEIKWPNDILCNGKKLSGMLIENTFSGGEISRSVIGIGINLASEKFPQTRFPATSVVLETGLALRPSETLMELLPYINNYFMSMRQNPQGLMGEYNSGLYGKDKPVKVRVKDADTFIQVKRVGSTGELHVILPDGSALAAGSDELKFIP